MLHRLLRPGAARRRLIGAAPYLEKHPESVWPKYIKKDGDFFILDSAIQPFCDAPIMMSCKFYRELCAWGKKHPCHRTILGFQELEFVLNCGWWRNHHSRRRSATAASSGITAWTTAGGQTMRSSIVTL